jgi:hypothetical protein
MAIHSSYNSGIVARFLSTGQTGAEYDRKMQILRAWCSTGHQLVERSSPDRRLIATGIDTFMWQYEPLSEDVAATSWLEMMWSYASEARALFSSLRSGLHHQKILATPQALDFDDKPFLNPKIDFYLINTFSLEVFEKTLETVCSPEEQELARYWAIDYSDLLNGETDQMFDCVRVSTWDVLDLDGSLIQGVLNSVKVGGTAFIYEVSANGDLYRDAMSVHEIYMYQINKAVAERSDFEVIHLPTDRGYIIARRIS